MDSTLVFLLVLSASSCLFWLARQRKVINRWSWIAMACLVGWAVVPEGGFRWALLALGLAAALNGLATVPRAFWQRYRVAVALGVCSLVAIWASEIFDLRATIVLWVIAISSGLFVTTVIVSAVRLIRSGRANAAQSRHSESSPR